MHQCIHAPVKIWNMAIALEVPSHKGPLFNSSEFPQERSHPCSGSGGTFPRQVDDSSCSSWDLVRNAHSWALSWPTESETLGGAQKSVFHEPSR